MAERPRRSRAPPGMNLSDETECKVQCSANQISENLPVGWKAVVEGEQGKVVYITTDGKELGSLAQARSYLEDKRMEAQDEEDILSSLEWNEAGASPDEFALKHGIRHRLRAHAAALPENGKKGSSSKSSNGGLKRSLLVSKDKDDTGSSSSSSRGKGGSSGSSKGAHSVGCHEKQEGARKRPKVDEEEDEEEEEEEEEGNGSSKAGSKYAKSRQGGGAGDLRVAIPSYLRSRFGDKGSALGDAPPTPAAKGSEGGGSGDEQSEAEYEEALDKMHHERSRRNTANRRRNKAEMQAADNNILLFGQWYRKKQEAKLDKHEAKHADKVLPNTHKLPLAPAQTPLRKPEMADLREFVLDRNAYWGDEIALRVFADVFKIVVCVVLQVEERLQVVFPPKGDARSLFYLVLTHRGAVPHYRSVAVGDRHVLPLHELLNVGCDGAPFVTGGMIGRLAEDCPGGWDTNLTAEALSFFKGRSETKMATIRHSVVRNAQTLREVKSEVAMEEQCSAGTAIQSWVIDGFPAGTGYVERIACSSHDQNPAFTISKTPGDGDCLFYSMIDVATEILRDNPPPGPSPEIDSLRGDDNLSKVGVTVGQLRQMVAESLTEEELAFFNAANDFT